MTFNRTDSGFLLNGTADRPDIRDIPYEPTLAPLKSKIDPPVDLRVLDQGREGACTGFGLAANINYLRQRSGGTSYVSPRMLYEMARRFDEWTGEDYEGSSCRGAIKGWFNMGVCTEKTWPYRTKPGQLTVLRAKEARLCPSGAYYRVQADVAHVHAALNEVGVIYCSAQVHKGWNTPEHYDNPSVFNQQIKWQSSYKPDGGHAFAVVGYNQDGLWVVNSWGEDWGLNGVALWTYEDWQKNVSDMWIIQLGLPTPSIDRTTRTSRIDDASDSAAKARKPRRDQIAGHFVHIDDGEFRESGRYWSDLNDVKLSAKQLAQSDKYDHLLLYGHGGLNSPEASACRIAAMRDTFKQNRIYPFHIMYDTGLMEELKDVIFNKRSKTKARVGGLTDWSDWLIEKIVHRPGRALWREMKRDASNAFQTQNAGAQTLKAILNAFGSQDARPKKIHLAGHSTGAVLHAHLLQALNRIQGGIHIESVSLFAPACSVDLFVSHYMPMLSGPNPLIKKLVIYNLNEKLELDDQVAGVYRKSLLCLVSNALEESKEEPILGMAEFEDQLPRLSRRVEIVVSNGRSGRTRSTSHGGFDNDPHTLNDMCKSILGASPSPRFTEQILDY